MTFPLRLLLSLLGVVLVFWNAPAFAATPVLSQFSVTPKANGAVEVKVRVQAIGAPATAKIEYRRDNDVPGDPVPMEPEVPANTTADLLAVIENLVGGQLYRFKVIAENGPDSSQTEEITIAIAAYAPRLGELTLTDKGSGTVTMKIPVTSNGAATTVTFAYKHEDDSTFTNSSKPADPNLRGDVLEFEPSGLVGGQTYDFKVTATNTHGQKETEIKKLTLGAYEPTIHRVFSSQLSLDSVVLTGEVTANGKVLGGGDDPDDRVSFTYWETSTGSLETGTVGVAKRSDGGTPDGSLRPDDIKLKFTFTPTGLKLDTSYSYKFRVGSKLFPDTLTFRIANNAPRANPDTVLISGTEPVVIDVLKNDRDPDGATLQLLGIRKRPSGGKASVVGGDKKKVLYTPESNFIGEDSFTYAITDGLTGGTVVGEVTILAPRYSLAGMHGGLILNGEGKNVGYVRLHAMAGGAFTGKIEIDGESYSLSGVMQLNGRYVGFATGDEGTIAVEFSLQEAEGGATSIVGNFGQGQWTTSMPAESPKLTDLTSLAGRYTVELPMGESTGEPGTGVDVDDESRPLPEGTGWMSLRVTEWGEARVKGKLPDGEGFSAKAVLFYSEEGLSFSFYSDPDDSRVSGQFEVGEEVTGTVNWERSTSDDDYFPRGFETTIEAAGQRYIEPEDGRRALEFGGENDFMTISFNGVENVPTFSRNLRISEDDEVQVLNGGNEDLRVDINREKGTFKTKFTDGNGNRRKGTGVLIQPRTNTETPRGVGVYRTTSRTSRIDLALTSTIEPAPAPTPNPNPNPNPTPNPNPNPNPNPQNPNGGNGGNNGGTGGNNNGGNGGFDFDGVFDDFVFDPL